MIVLGWSFKLLFVGWPGPIWRRCANSEALGPWPHLLPWWISTCNLSLCCCWYCPPSRCCSLFDFPLLRPPSTPPALTSITSATFLFARGKSLNHVFLPVEFSAFVPLGRSAICGISSTFAAAGMANCTYWLNHGRKKVATAFFLQVVATASMQWCDIG